MRRVSLFISMNSVCYVGGIYAVRKTHSLILSLFRSLSFSSFLYSAGFSTESFRSMGFAPPKILACCRSLAIWLMGSLGRNGGRDIRSGGVLRGSKATSFFCMTRILRST
jgi:hypothetical protein